MGQIHVSRFYLAGPVSILTILNAVFTAYFVTATKNEALPSPDLSRTDSFPSSSPTTSDQMSPWRLVSRHDT